LSRIFKFSNEEFSAMLLVDREVEESGRINFKGSYFEKENILWRVREYVAYPINYRPVEEMIQECGVSVDHSMLNRWVIKYAPEVEK